MFCVYCGSQAPVTDHFCKTCGQALGGRSALMPVAILLTEEPGHPTEEPKAAKAGASPPPVDLTIPLTLTVSEDTPGSIHLPFSEFTVPDEAKARMTHAGSGHRRRSLVLLAAVSALVLLGVLGSVWSTRTSGAPPADPTQALQRLKDVARINMPIDALDSSNYLVPASMAQEPSPAGESMGSVSMGSGDTIELRVAAYALSADAAHYALWWNTSGAKEYFAETSAVSVAVQCGRIVIDGAWVDRHSQSDTVKLLHQAYPDCTPYIPEKAPIPAPNRTQPPAVDGYVPRDARVGAGDRVAGAFVISDLVTNDDDTTNTTVSFTVRNTTRQAMNLLPQVSVHADIDTSHILTSWGAESGPGIVCHTLRPNEVERIKIGGGTTFITGGDGNEHAFPINWTSALVANGSNGC